MSDLGLSTIAQLLFLNERSIDFARIVSELEGVLTRLQPQDVRLQWDCDDYVCFDIPRTRIQLAWAEVDRRGYRGCLSVAVGPGEQASRGYHEDMCSRLVDRIQSRFDPVSVLWCQAEGAVESEVLDDLLDHLPHLGNALPDIESVIATLTEQEAELSAKSTRVPALRPAQYKAQPVAAAPLSAAPLAAANDQPDLPRQSSQELEQVRRTLYPQDGQPYTTQMRLAVHCLNATLIVVWAPMGVALMTYSILRGENMRLSSRVMAVSGTLFALAHTPVGLTVATLAKSIGQSGMG